MDNSREELSKLKVYYSSLLETLEPGVLVLDANDRVISDNEGVCRLWNLGDDRMKGQLLSETSLARLCADLPHYVKQSQQGMQNVVRFVCETPEKKSLTIAVKSVFSEAGGAGLGTVIHMQDTTAQRSVQETIEQLQATSEELQSANEELETANEELQSTNEELETTNEELQSSNEELETTNEELQSLNEELETTNEELAERSRELDEINTRYVELLKRMPWPVLLVNANLSIPLWSAAAQKLFGFATPSENGMSMRELPLDSNLQKLLIRRHKQVIGSGKEAMLRRRQLRTNRFSAQADIHLVPLRQGDAQRGVLLMFENLRQIESIHDDHRRRRQLPKAKIRVRFANGGNEAQGGAHRPCAAGAPFVFAGLRATSGVFWPHDRWQMRRQR